MKWYFSYPLVTVLGIAFWIFASAMKDAPGGTSFLALEPGAFLGLGAWMCACWAGMIFHSMAQR
jgi:hypothetical protein